MRFSSSASALHCDRYEPLLRERAWRIIYERTEENMPAKNHDLHGNVPDACAVALLLIDVINDLEFAGGRTLVKTAVPAAARIAALKRRARRAGVPVIYANDNFGRWRSDFGEVVEHCLHDGVRGHPLAEMLAPDPDDYFVLKPKHSAFFSTTLATLLKYLKVERLVLTGFAGDACVLISAADAYMRDFELFVPADCTASKSALENRRALSYMARVLDADTRVSRRLDLAALARWSGEGTARRGRRKS
jgi:nicotinamidase-related amidase